jgi:hypothetical protein
MKSDEGRKKERHTPSGVPFFFEMNRSRLPWDSRRFFLLGAAFGAATLVFVATIFFPSFLYRREHVHPCLASKSLSYRR